MKTQLTLDKAGRLVIPKPLRDQWGLEPGDCLELESEGESISLRPVRGTGQMQKENGVWVFYGEQPLPASATDDVLQLIREERDLSNLGNER